MKIIYHCWGAAHSSVTAAAIHLGLLPEDRVPSAVELLKLPYFDKQTRAGHGVLHFYGVDQAGNEVFILGRESHAVLVPRIVLGLAAVVGVDPHELRFVDTMPCVNLLMMLGGFLSRSAGLVFPGRSIVTFGTRLAYMALSAVARRERERAAKPEPVATRERTPPAVVYNCFGSAHSSVVTAAIHLGLLPCDRVPSSREIASVPLYDRVDTAEIGTIFFAGKGADGRNVYILGAGPAKALLPKLAGSLLRAYGVQPEDVVLVNCLKNIGLLTRVGGFLSRELGWVKLGRPMSAYGIRRCYDRLAASALQPGNALTDKERCLIMEK
ncbi:MAG: DUF3189 family protein [Bacillota bacterium]